MAGVTSPHLAEFFPYIADTSLRNPADVKYDGGFEAFGDGETGFQPVADAGFQPVADAGAAPVFFEDFFGPREASTFAMAPLIS